jgi:hypothetical protein
MTASQRPIDFPATRKVDGAVTDATAFEAG